MVYGDSCEHTPTNQGHSPKWIVDVKFFSINSNVFIDTLRTAMPMRFSISSRLPISYNASSLHCQNIENAWFRQLKRCLCFWLKQ